GLLSRIRSEFDFIQGNFLVLVLSWIIMDLASELPSTYYGLYVEALGGSATVIGIIGFVSMFAQAFVMFPGGYLADKYGRRWLVSTMTFGIAFSFAFYAFAPSWHWIMVGALIQSFCFIYRPALEAIIMDSVPAERRGMSFSIMNLIMSVSTTPSPLIAGWLFNKFGLIPSVRMGYTLVFASYLAAGVIRLRLKETLQSPKRISLGEMLRSYPSSIVESIRVWGLVPRSAFALFLSRFVMMFAIAIFQPIMVLYVVEDLGIPAVGWSLILTSLFVSMIVISLPVGKLIDRVGKKRPLLAAFAIWAAVMPLFIYGNFHRLLVAMILVGLLQVLLMASSSSLMADLVPREHRGKVSGSSGFFVLIAGSVGSLLGGFVYDNVSHQMPWWLQIVFVVPSFLLVLLFVREPEKHEINRA
ncbi:MAG: MFS transporter, partial [Candidatus Bathyarchaeia archaeon]